MPIVWYQAANGSVVHYDKWSIPACTPTDVPQEVADKLVATPWLNITILRPAQSELREPDAGGQQGNLLTGMSDQQHGELIEEVNQKEN